MSHNDVFPVPREWAAKAWANAARYHAMYRRSVDDPEGFWGEQGKRLDWMKPYTKVKDVSFASDDLHVRWFEDGTLNACHNCVVQDLVDHRLGHGQSRCRVEWAYVSVTSPSSRSEHVAETV